MHQAVRSVRAYSPKVFFSSTPNQLRQRASRVSFRQFTTMSNKPEGDNKMDKAQKSQNPTEKEGDLMSHSFGEGYATRSDEEGFGGIYGGNQSIPDDDTDKKIHENHPSYDKTQGSEVKEKEKARFQTNG
ncbi:hypothetical protein K2173_006060 [Erythroxylum novogranatense]|uniref:Late embryogenesis abundant protein n=1 Tax=Erythroxylum novogranatense TaxID=1862640 RepID=A0AAV8TC45_9ROSI|nr:hypothetical protein K2173_006060 [Erythroxylum novogranatense]